MSNTEEIVNLLEVYVKLEEKIKEIKNPEALKENKDYRNFLSIGHEIEKQVLKGGEIIEIYRNVKSNIEEEYKSKIKNLEEIIFNLKNSKNNLNNLIKNPNNFFNGEIVNEIKKWE